ncbi:MAG: hypothetical protein K0Q73_1841 [Paenibacillus sp.]|jgi:hypothetical protein|nr:hypothetical protein [Paenibacillus sp.]
MFSFRLYDVFDLTDSQFEQLLDLFHKYEGAADALTFFTTSTHAPIPLAAAKERVAVLKERMREVRRRGFRTGINVMTTIGHHNEHLPYSLSGPYTRMTNIEGDVCQGSFCPNDEQMRQYVKELYRIVTLAEPEYIWLDDDIRFTHKPIGQGCFCETCIQLFSIRTGVPYTRELLKQKFNEGPESEKLAIRREWLQHNRSTLNRLLQLIEQTVHEISPDMPIGFMSGDRFYEGYDFPGMERSLSNNGETNVMWRPGGGFYWDERLAELTVKSHAIGRQVSLLPDRVTDIQSEIENFPYQRLRKSDRVTAVEAACHIAAGCTGAAYNVLSLTGGEQYDDEYGPLLRQLQKSRPFYDLLVGKLNRSKPIGLHTGWNMDSFAAQRLSGNWFEGFIGNITGHHAQEMYELGLPPAYSESAGVVTLLAGESVRAMNSKQIEHILQNGVYMDGQALEQLCAMGYGEEVGFRVESFAREDCIEQFTDHPLNGAAAGRKRNCRQSFWNVPAALLGQAQPGAAALSRIVNYANEEVSPCGSGIFENKLGGRICVAGYYPWTMLQNQAKSIQLRRLMRWLSKDRLPAYIASFHKCNLWVREMADGRYGIVLLNSSMDQANDLVLNIKTNSDRIRITDMQCNDTMVTASSSNSGYSSFPIPPIDNWDVRFIELM